MHDDSDIDADTKADNAPNFEVCHTWSWSCLRLHDVSVPESIPQAGNHATVRVWAGIDRMVGLY